MVSSNYLPIEGDGWPKAMRHENAFWLCGQNLGYHCHCPPKTLLKFEETGGTVTHTLQVLHTLLWTQPSKDNIIQAFHSYTHTLLGAVVKEVVGPTGLSVRSEQNTELLSCCGLTRTPLRVPVPRLGGKEFSAAEREYVSFMAESFFIFFAASLSCCGLTRTPLRVPLPRLGGKEFSAAEREYVSFMAESFFIFFAASPFVWCDLRPFCWAKNCAVKDSEVHQSP